MKYYSSMLAFGSLTLANTFYPEQQAGYGSSAAGNQILYDMSIIQQHWGQISPMVENDDRYFGVQDVAIPDGCSIEQVHILHRHAQRGPTSFYDDATNDERFAMKLLNFTSASPSKKFTGPLSFLNTYRYQLGESLLTGIGAATEFQSGVTHWNRYGRILYNATAGQLQYNASFVNGTARPKPVFRTTSQSRIYNSLINFALGFFGPSFQPTPNPTLANSTSPFNVVVIPEGGTENNTLASYDSCLNDGNEPWADLGDQLLEKYIPIYMSSAVSRMQQYAPSGFTFNVNDTYAMQSICAYETGYIGSSDFCPLFTANEWLGFENTLSMEYYYDYAWGNPTGRAQGIGYLEELMARLTNQYINSSDSSVNYTITNNTNSFPLGEPLYVDLTHDDIIISVLTAMSFDYFKTPPSLSQYPPATTNFRLSKLTPFGARLVTEVIGCSASNPPAVHDKRVQYYQSQFGYSPSNASNKFIRLRLNNGILPVSTIRGGACSGRTDGLCSMKNFLSSQTNATKLANYQFACFGNYSAANLSPGKDFDGSPAYLNGP